MTVIPFTFPGVPHVHAAFTTRLGGVSQGPFHAANLSWEVGDEREAVAENRRNLQRILGVVNWVEARQVHGSDVLVEPEPGMIIDFDAKEGDGLITSRPGQVLAVKTADCQPILLAHASGRHVAALHCGWRGNRQEFPQRGVAAFCKACDIAPEKIFAVRGPSLGPSASEFVNFDLEWGSGFRNYYDPVAKTMDLWCLTRDQLLQAGLRQDRIFSVDLCTYSLPGTFFSYRRDKTTGRQAGLIWIVESPVEKGRPVANSRQR
ncbi:MAG TPA: laccase domain-containing protein [Desulfonatronum sp.]|nr:laccase domain-containing protein [Desulfonatronum sp.]